MSPFKLLQDLENNHQKLYIQFGGQGGAWFKELHKYYDNPDFKPFFNAAIAGIEKTLEMVGDTPALPEGLAIRQWLENPDSIPSDAYLAIAPVSMPMIMVTQMAHVENVHLQGLSRESLIQHAAGATGHSQGLIMASFFALNKSGEEYYDALTKYVQYLFLMGIRAQEVYPYPFPDEKEVERSVANGVKDPAPMVAVLGESHEFIEDLVEKANPDLPDSEKIYVSLYNTPSNRILSSYRESLIRFHEKNKSVFEEKGMKYVYLRTSCPFHCVLMEPIKEKFAKDIEAIGFDYKGSDLQIPVISFADGRNLQNDSEIGMAMCHDLMVATLYWDKAMSFVSSNAEVPIILDFGPGKTSQRLSADTLKGLGSEKQIFAAAVAKDLKAILAG
ncbi:MAG: ACP S-malonyltransferase [Candidatus Hydrogenedentota bacterium]|nr:MAG: ACP S-malonyltransferase [Candidatus Hydrogenedentota bacterium]